MNHQSEDFSDLDVIVKGANKPPDPLMLHTKFSSVDDQKGLYIIDLIRGINRIIPLYSQNNFFFEKLTEKP
jgi:hypothetical protein